MKRLYWRPRKVSRKVLVVIAVMSILSLVAVESYRVEKKQPHYTKKIRASRLALKAFEAIKQERQRKRIAIDRNSDPTESGLIGTLLSSTTTNPGHLPAKQTSINPNFAGVIVGMLLKTGVEPNDAVAVGLSGSFPAINIAVLTALQSLEVTPIVITSIGASQWGANLPTFPWPEFERVLEKNGILQFHSVAMSLGGVQDQAQGMSSRGIGKLKDAVLKHGVPLIHTATVAESIDKRMSIYQEHAGDKEIKVYINVGGGIASVGSSVGKRLFRPGLNRYPPPGISEIDSVMARFAVDGAAVIHMTKIETLAEKYGLPLVPQEMPRVGKGKIFRRQVYNIWLVVAALAAIFFALWAFVRMDWGYRVFGSGKSSSSSSSRPEPMV